ncbi:PQQ-binding-like beta-propeller repeat protein [candidate division KSB1 bacterium]|nr:PQQ-binding-like beta-propeller repeat protein [candidate division KSB1 bacterium]
MKFQYLIPLFIILLFSAGFAEDWQVFGGDSLHSRFAAETSDTLYRDQLWLYEAGGPIFASPIIHDHTVYFASIDNYVYAAIDSTGQIKWQCKLGNWIESSPTVANGMVYVGCMDHKLYAINAESGTIAWEFATGSWIESSPLVVDASLYVGGTDHTLYCLDALTGEEKWRFSAGKDVCSSPVYFDQMIFFGSDDGCFYAVDTQGQLVWKYDTGGYSIYASPSAADSVIVIGTIDNGALAARTTGRIESINNEILGLDAYTGEVRWQIATEAFGLMHASPAIAYGKVYYPTDQAHLHAIDLKTGERLWEIVTPDSSMIWASPAVAAGVVYVTTYQGNLYLFGADSGNALGQLKVTEGDAYIHSSPAIADNFLYFGDSSGKLYAFGKLAQTPSFVRTPDQLSPDTYALSQNYPNPFNSQTQIRYSLLKPAHVKIKIYNSRGQLIRTLANRNHQPGTYQLNWNGLDDSGMEVASGVYAYRIEADDFARSYRMLFIK